MLQMSFFPSIYVLSYTATTFLINSPFEFAPNSSFATVLTNIFRIFLYYGEASRKRSCHWGVPLSAILVIFLEYASIAYRLSQKPWRKPRGSLQQASASRVDGTREVEKTLLDLKWGDLWLWTDFLSYIMFALFLVVLLLLFTGLMLPQPPPLYLAAIGFGAALSEIARCLPRLGCVMENKPISPSPLGLLGTIVNLVFLLVWSQPSMLWGGALVSFVTEALVCATFAFPAPYVKKRPGGDGAMSPVFPGKLV